MRPGLLKSGPARATLIFLLALALLPPWPIAASAAEATLQVEKELGERFHLQLAATGAFMHDPLSNEYYGKVADRILRGAGLEPGQYKFYIVKNDSINVLALLGDYIYMFTGTIISLENEGQLAALLAHEMAHLTSRHFARKIEVSGLVDMAFLRAMLVSMVVTSQSGYSSETVDQARMINGGGITIWAFLENSNEDESEADAKSRQYLTKADYDISDMYGALNIMRTKAHHDSYNTIPYISIHSFLFRRLYPFLKDVETVAPSPPDLAYQAFRKRVMALAGEPRRVEKTIDQRLNVDKNDHSAIHALGLLAARQQNLDTADKLMKQALALAPNNKEYLADLGDLALRCRKPDEAKAYYEQAGPDNPQVVLGLARASELLGDTDRAAALYDQVVDITTESYPEALELAGRFFYQDGQKAKGHYYLGRYFVSVGNLDKAVLNFQEAAAQPEAGEFRALAEQKADYLNGLKKGGGR